MELDRKIQEALAEPFPPGEVGHRKGQGGGTFAYLDRCTVMDRLDAVVPGQWHFEFTPLNPECTLIKGRLTVCGVVREDVGQPPGQTEPQKSAVTDALKRCADQFGVGRYLRDDEPPQQHPPARYDVKAGAARAMERTAQERGLGPAPIVGGNGEPDISGFERATLRLKAVCDEVGIDWKNGEWMGKIIAIALDRSAAVKDLDTADRGLLAEWINEHPKRCVEQKPQAGALPLDVEAAVPAGLATS